MKSVQLLNKNFSFLERWYPIILVILSIIIFLPGLGEGSLRDWDEAIYAQISREIVQNGDWINLQHGYQPFFEKPPLLMWITAIFYNLFGVNEFWARVPSAISGILLIWMTYLSGEAIYEKQTGFLAGLILLGCYGFVFESRNGETDMMLSLFVFSGIFAYLRLKNGNPKWWYLIWASCAFAFMVKFWAGLVLPVTLAIIILLERKIKEILHNKHFWLGVLLAIIIVVPWHLQVYMENGMAFFDVYIARDLFERTLTSMEGHSGTSLFYLDTLRRLFSPWYFLFPFVLVLAIKQILAQKQKSNIIFVEILLVFGLYTFLVNTKNPSYIFPIFPALSILTGRLFVLALSTPRSITFASIITALLIATTVVQDKLLILCILVVFGLVILLKTNLLSKKSLPRIFTGLVFSVFFLTNILTYVLGNHRLRIWPLYGMQVSPVAQISTFAYKDHSTVTDPLICFAMEEDWASELAVEGPTAMFYSNRPIEKVITWNQLSELMAEKKSSEILIAEKYIPQLSEEFEILVVKEVSPLVYAVISH